MRIAIKQPYFLPYIGYFQVIGCVDKYIIYHNLNYIKEGWIHRNRLLRVNGEPEYFKIHLENKTSFQKIDQVRVSEGDHWRRKMIKSIYLNYKRSGYFDEVFPVISEVVEFKTSFLWEMAAFSTVRICRYLDIKTEITTDNSGYLPVEDFLQGTGYLNSEIKEMGIAEYIPKLTRILYICKKENSDHFIESPGGISLYPKEIFSAHSIKIDFLKVKEFTYKQSTDKFHPHLSIVDVLMNCGREKTKELLKEFTFL
jgi:hypothetical protein